MSKRRSRTTEDLPLSAGGHDGTFMNARNANVEVYIYYGILIDIYHFINQIF